MAENFTINADSILDGAQGRAVQERASRDRAADAKRIDDNAAYAASDPAFLASGEGRGGTGGNRGFGPLKWMGLLGKDKIPDSQERSDALRRSGPPTGENADSVDNYRKLIDPYLDSAIPAELRTGQAAVDQRTVLDPQNTQLDLDLIRKYEGQFIDEDVKNQSSLKEGLARGDVNLLRGTGKDLVTANLEAQKIADPEYYKTRAATSDQLSRLFGTLEDPDGGLSPTERAEIDRSLARDNQARGLEAPTATSAVQAGMDFGAAGASRKQAKQQTINAAMQTATQMMPNLKSGVDVLQLTTGRPSQVGQGNSRFGDNPSVGQGLSNIGQNFMGQIGTGQGNMARIKQSERESKRAQTTALATGAMSAVGGMFNF